MTPDRIEVTAVSCTWDPERTAEAAADGRTVVNRAFAANPDSLEGVRRVVVDASEWGLHIYCTESPSLMQMSLWRDIWESMTNRIIHWYHFSGPGPEERMENWEASFYLGLERMVEVLHSVIGGKFSKEDANAVYDLRWSLDARNHPLIDDIVNAIAFKVHQRKEGKP